MNALTEKALKKTFGAKAKCVPLCALDDVFALDKLAEEIGAANTSDDLATLNLPVTVGNVSLYRPTYGALIWLDDVAGRLFGGDARLMDCALLYALAFSNRPEKFAELNGWRAAFMVKFFAARITASTEELRAAIETLMPRAAKSGGAQSNEDAGAGRAARGLTLALTAAFPGTTPQYWLWTASYEEMIDALNFIGERNAEEASAISGSKQSYTSDRARRAHVAFAKAAVAFEAKYAGKN